MTITIEKKHLYVAGAIIASFLIAFVIIKTCGSSNYESKAKNMKMNAKSVVGLSLSILADYQKNWNSAINNHTAINAKGERDYTNDFNEAVGWRYAYYFKKGYIEIIDSLVDIVKSDMKSMNNPPSKYRDVHSSLLEVYNNMNSLVSLVKQPKGSLLTFGQTVNELARNIEKAYLESDLTIPVKEEEQLRNDTELMTTLVGKRTDEEKEKQNIANEHMKETLENVKAYKDKGFIPVENGSNVLYKEIRKGTGPIPRDSSYVKIHYEGRLLNGKIFDSTYKRGTLVKMRVNAVLDGLTEVLRHMPVGSKWEVFIPYDKAYGEKGAGMIEPYSDLLFTIELLKIEDK